MTDTELACSVNHNYREGYEQGKKDSMKWIPCSERFPDTDDYILLSIEGHNLPVVGRYEEDSEGGAFYMGDNSKSLVSLNIFVIAWMPLPEPYIENNKCSNCSYYGKAVDAPETVTLDCMYEPTADDDYEQAPPCMRKENDYE